MTHRGSPPRPLAWLLLFVAILAHLPALASWLGGGDWVLLARGAGVLVPTSLPPWPLGSLFFWRLGWTAFGLSASAYHATALVLAAVLAILCGRLAWRLGLGPTGASVAGLVMAGTPFLVLPVAAITSMPPLLALLFAVGGFVLWLEERPWGAPLGAISILFALLCDPSVLLLPLLLPLADRWWGGSRVEPWTRRVRWALALLLLAVSAASVALARHDGMATSRGIRSLWVTISQLGVWLPRPSLAGSVGGEAPSPWGLLIWVAWVGWAAWRWRRGQRAAAWALGWALAIVGTRLLLSGPDRAFAFLGVIPAWGWTLGSAADSSLGGSVDHLRMRSTRTATAVLLCAGVLVGAVGWMDSRAHLGWRDADGQLADPVLRRASIARAAAVTIHAISPRPGDELAVLQAVPEQSALPAPARTGAPAQSPLVEALQGRLGLGLIAGSGVKVQWAMHLDGVGRDGTVLLDAGGPILHVLGPVENARMYSALIAVGAGQFGRARHDLWNVVETVGAKVRFAYDADALPVKPADLDAQAPGFVAFVGQDDSAVSRRILRLFAQLYEAVRGRSLQPLLAPPWGGVLKGENPQSH